MAADLLDVHGLLFKRQQYKEADLLAKLWTKELGIVTVIAKGGMRPKSQLAAAVLLYGRDFWHLDPLQGDQPAADL